MFTAGVDYSSYFARCHWHESCSSPSLSKQQKAFGLICLRVARKFLSLCVVLFCLTTWHGSRIWLAIPARSWRTDPYSVMPGKFSMQTLQDTPYFSSVLYYLPICIPEVDENEDHIIKPCRSLCEQVQSDYSDQKHHWPKFLRCEELPDFSDGMCIHPDSFISVSKPSGKLKVVLKRYVFTEKYRMLINAVLFSLLNLNRHYPVM